MEHDMETGIIQWRDGASDLKGVWDPCLGGLLKGL